MRSKRALGVILGLAIAAPRLGAQAWNDSRVRALVQQATDRRVQQLADSGLVGYQATAHGYLTSLAQLGEGLRELPRVVKADELALEVYWRAPNLSKQRIVGRRDTTLLPTDVQYHQDHLGIVQNNFPAIIRIGDGDEVRDVPHPLSPAGLQEYDFALTDSLRITTPERVIDVYEIKVRPKDHKLPRFIGAVYIDRENAQVVRMAFGFTRSAYVDALLEDVSVVLENGVVGGRFWLPRKQEIEIRRKNTFLDYPVRLIIRGRWTIGDYSLTVAPPIRFAGPEIVFAPPAVLRQYVWPPGRLTDSLPVESRLPTPDEIKRTLDEVRSLAVARATQRGRMSLYARNASDIVRFDRNSGLSFGSGVALHPGGPWTATANARFGFADHKGRGHVSFGRESARGAGLEVFASNDVRSAGDFDERSRMMNTVAAQEFGSDFTDNYAVRETGMTGTMPWRAAQVSLTLAKVNEGPLEARATPFSGRFQPAFDAADRTSLSAGLALGVPTSALWGFEWRFRGDAEAKVRWDLRGCPVASASSCGPSTDIARFTAKLDVERTFGAVRLAHRTFAGTTYAPQFIVPQDLFFLGGPVSAPGYAYHSLVGDRVLSQAIEMHVPVPFPRVSLGRFGRSPGRASLVPHWSIAGIHQDSGTPIWRNGGPVSPEPLRATPSGWHQSAGVSLITGFDLFRLDLSRSLPRGGLLFSIDVTRPFWGIL